ncbi:hypothetical protein [Malaciobacter mytili]|uniref:hypothetical protein n=1 Tax=Malaciobacter mytili TaxID=603050 RepID=UPI0013E95AE5|nr:hypothetical protein [Malaciobacter mytili]
MAQIDKKIALKHVNDFFEDIYDTAIFIHWNELDNVFQVDNLNSGKVYRDLR